MGNCIAMAKRTFEESEDTGEDIDLDRQLHPQKLRRVEGASNKVHTDPENIMDNWFISSREERNQRFSMDRTDREAWLARKHLDPSAAAENGRWYYVKDKNERRWTFGRTNSDGLSRKTGELTLNERSGGRHFPAERGDEELSEIFREFWRGGDQQCFFDTLYRRYGANDTIPEKTVWKIFRCLVGELVPEDQKWDDAPAYILAEPNTIWQVGKCMLQILTYGRFWDSDFNVLNPIDRGEKFGKYKQNVLQNQKKYSKDLIKHILACLSSKEFNRPTREDLLQHFQRVFSIYDGTYVAEPVDETPDVYTPTSELIPDHLTREEGKVYEILLDIVEQRKKTRYKTPLVITITDLAKDYDDLMAMMVLKELHRLGVVQIKGFVANLMPANRRALFGRGALDALKLDNIKIAVGSKGDPTIGHEDIYPHEFGNMEGFMIEDKDLTDPLPDGQRFLHQLFSDAVDSEQQLTLLTISSLMDIAEFSEAYPDLLKKGLSNVVLQGGYRVLNGVLTADPAAANNKFDLDGAKKFHKYMQENKIKSTAWTKVATNAVPIYNTLFEFLDETGHPLGHYLREVQVKQDLNFYARSCTDKPFAPHMTQDWYVATKSTWFAAGHEPDEPYPLREEMIPYFTKVVAYDALAAVGTSGEDVLDALKIIKPLIKRTDNDHPFHHLVGVPETRGTDTEPGLPAEANLDAEMMGITITALMKGSILATQQGCPYNGSPTNSIT